jgi:uncharacterized RDD family membrane protein YckC
MGMGQQWYYTQSGAQVGPVATDVLRQMLAAGQVGADELVWSDGMPDWQRARDVATFFAPPPPQQQPQQPYYAGVPQQQPYAGQAGAFPSPYPGGPAAPINYYTPQQHYVQYGGFWLRFCALFVDSLILMVIQFPIGWALGVPFWEDHPAAGPAAVNQIASILIWWLYAAFQESSVHQATLGKRAVGIVVTDTMGQRITFARATGRHFGQYISGLILGIGYLMAAFTQRKQALHDIMAETLVIRKPQQ